MIRQKDINGRYISNAVAYCHCINHPGALSRSLAYKHKCIGKKCKHLEIYNANALKRKKYKNKR